MAAAEERSGIKHSRVGPAYQSELPPLSLTRAHGHRPRAGWIDGDRVDDARAAPDVLCRCLEGAAGRGVPRATVVADYALSNTCTRERALAMLARHRRIVEAVTGVHLEFAPNAALEAFRDVVGVRPANIEAAMDAIDARHGSFEQYLLAEYGVTALDVQIIRAQYLVPCTAPPS